MGYYRAMALLELLYDICYHTTKHELCITMDLAKELGRKIKEFRLRKKLSHGKLAELLGVHPTYISSLERGMRNLTVKSLDKIAKALDTKVKNLID